MAVRKIKLIIFFLLSLWGLNSCYYDNKENLYGNEECDSTTVLFSKKIEPIISRRCARCHSGNNPSGNIELYDYISTVNYVNQSQSVFMGSIKWNGTASNMPKNDSKLSDCKINLIQAWINQGMKP